MNNNKLNLAELLSYIDPALLDYQEWLNVGMALKYEGYSVGVWDDWSRKDSKRYVQGECYSKWNTFNGSAIPVTGGSIYQLACDFGYKPTSFSDEAMSWDDEINRDPLKVLEGIEVQELKIPETWHPKEQLIKYLETLFDADENVGYVTECWQNDNGKYLPKKGCFDRTAGQLIQELSNLQDDDIGAVLGDYNPEVGAWIRFNPLDGHGVKNDNVTDFRYALVESDSIDISTQNSIIRELELPVAALVYSGGKSIHAIVRVDAVNAKEYSERVKVLYNICRKNGLEIDKQNKNPSRLSRMPGVLRNGKKQYLLDTNIGKENWSEWYEWIESINDDLPDPESLTDFINNLPELAPPLINNVLRQGHKMLITGPSKAGKSFALIELTIAIAEGGKWFGFDCTQGKVLYVNLEVDKASCLHRFSDVYKALGYKPNNVNNIDIWNLRGKSTPMDKLAPKLIRRAIKKNYIAVIIDPIYKVLTGDENSAEQMSKFCNEFDKICSELGCAVIYCHHHSKGNQGLKKSMDRASGSGVFARDPDAMIDLVELELSDNIKRYQEQKAECEIYYNYLKRFLRDVDEVVSQDDALSAVRMREIGEKYLPKNTLGLIKEELNKSEKTVYNCTGWQIEGTLREFPKFEPIYCWFDYPIHVIDRSGMLRDLETTVNAKNSKWKDNFGHRKSKEDNAKSRKMSFETHYESLSSFEEDGKVTLKAMAEQLNKGESTIRRWIENEFSEDYRIVKGEILKIE